MALVGCWLGGRSCFLLTPSSPASSVSASFLFLPRLGSKLNSPTQQQLQGGTENITGYHCSQLGDRRTVRMRRLRVDADSADLPTLDLTEENIIRVLEDAKSEFEQIFDASVGITGEVKLSELDGPFVKLSLKGRFWHKRSTVLARLDAYLKRRIPEILEVDIEDEKQLDDSPANF